MGNFIFYRRILRVYSSAHFFCSSAPSWLISHGTNARVISKFRRLRADMIWDKEIETFTPKTEKKRADGRFFQPPICRISYCGWYYLRFFRDHRSDTLSFITCKKFFKSAAIYYEYGPFLLPLAGFINSLATLFSVWMLDKIGRTGLLLVGSWGMTIQLGVLRGFFSTMSAIGGSGL